MSPSYLGNEAPASRSVLYIFFSRSSLKKICQQPYQSNRKCLVAYGEIKGDDLFSMLVPFQRCDVRTNEHTGGAIFNIHQVIQ